MRDEKKKAISGKKNRDEGTERKEYCLKQRGTVRGDRRGEDNVIQMKFSLRVFLQEDPMIK